MTAAPSDKPKAPGSQLGPLPIFLSNTLTGKKDKLEPLQSPRVGMYACGVTVYDEVHLGHALQAVFFDVIRRFMDYAGYEVNYVRNYTDVDDKILARAKEKGQDPFALAAHFVQDTDEVLTNLKVRPPNAAPKVTDHIPDIIALIQKLVDKGSAYHKDGSVYFDVSTFETYGKLSHQDLDTLRDLAPKEFGKDDPVDFALWKKRHDGEAMFWDSPWGEGRPGWHIECSAMSMKYLGDSFDIHGGGVDLVFPHHENEIAQSEAATGKTYACCWLHNGLITVGGTKMSKSLGNFMTIREALNRYPALVLRHAILQAHFTSQVEFGETVLTNSTKRVYYFHRTLLGAKTLLENAAQPLALGRENWPESVSTLQKQFVEALQDNINTAASIVVLGDLMSQLNRTLSKPKQSPDDFTFLAAGLELAEEMNEILDLLEVADPQQLVEDLQERILKSNGTSKEAVVALIQERITARAAKDFAKSDELRQKLTDLGVKVLDSKDGNSVWQVDPEKMSATT